MSFLGQQLFVQIMNSNSEAYVILVTTPSVLDGVSELTSVCSNFPIMSVSVVPVTPEPTPGTYVFASLDNLVLGRGSTGSE